QDLPLTGEDVGIPGVDGARREPGAIQGERWQGAHQAEVTTDVAPVTSRFVYLDASMLADRQRSARIESDALVRPVARITGDFGFDGSELLDSPDGHQQQQRCRCDNPDPLHKPSSVSLNATADNNYFGWGL